MKSLKLVDSKTVGDGIAILIYKPAGKDGKNKDGKINDGKKGSDSA
jgi:hypothetical protein